MGYIYGLKFIDGLQVVCSNGTQVPIFGHDTPTPGFDGQKMVLEKCKNDHEMVAEAIRRAAKS